MKCAWAVRPHGFHLACHCTVVVCVSWGRGGQRLSNLAPCTPLAMAAIETATATNVVYVKLYSLYYNSYSAAKYTIIASPLTYNYLLSVSHTFVCTSPGSASTPALYLCASSVVISSTREISDDIAMEWSTVLTATEQYHWVQSYGDIIFFDINSYILFSF